MTSFTSSVNNNNVILKWRTASETNNSGFDIERSSYNYQLSTNLEFGISDLEFVSLKDYDITWKKVMTLVNETRPAGFYKVKFDGSNP